MSGYLPPAHYPLRKHALQPGSHLTRHQWLCLFARQLLVPRSLRPGHVQLRHQCKPLQRCHRAGGLLLGAFEILWRDGALERGCGGAPRVLLLWCWQRMQHRSVQEPRAVTMHQLLCKNPLLCVLPRSCWSGVGVQRWEGSSRRRAWATLAECEGRGLIEPLPWDSQGGCESGGAAWEPALRLAPITGAGVGACRVLGAAPFVVYFKAVITSWKLEICAFLYFPVL